MRAKTDEDIKEKNMIMRKEDQDFRISIVKLPKSAQ